MWEVWVKYSDGQRSCIDQFDSEIKAYRFKIGVLKEFWVEKKDKIYVKKGTV